MGQAPQARIGYLGKNSDRYCEVLLGAFKARTVVVGVNWRLAVPEIAYVLNDAGCEVLFVGSDYYDIVQQIAVETPKLKTVIAIDGGREDFESYEGWRDAHPATDPDAAKSRRTTISSSSTPPAPPAIRKVSQLTNANYFGIFRCLSDMPLGAYTPEDVVLMAMPFFHVAGVNIALLVARPGRPRRHPGGHRPAGDPAVDPDEARHLHLSRAGPDPVPAAAAERLALSIFRRSRTSPTAPRRFPTPF